MSKFIKTMTWMAIDYAGKQTVSNIIVSDFSGFL